MSFGDVFQRLAHEYYQLTAAERRIADYVSSHQKEAPFLSISEMAEQVGVAEATVTRFCRRLGFKGYNAFKLELVNAAAFQAPGNPLAGEVLPEDSPEDMCRKISSAHIQAIERTRELIRPQSIARAADLLLAARHVICMGQGGSMILAQEAAHLFSTALPNFNAVPDSHMQAIRASLLDSRDAILYFSYSGSTRDLAEMMKIVRQREIPLILVTRFPNCPCAAEASVVLECGSQESPLQLGSVAAKMAQLYLIDVLFSEVFRRDMESIRRRRNMVADALMDKHL